MAKQAGELKEKYRPKEAKILGEDEYNNFDDVYVCIECGCDFLGKSTTDLCIHCLNVIHGELK